MKPIQQIKTDLLNYLTYRLHHPYAVTEGLNYSDVFSINRIGYSCDYEIKTSKADLDNELKCINNTTITDWHRADHKYQKHHYYLERRHTVAEYQPNWFGGLLPFNYTVPNKFCFVIPANLLEHLQSKIAHLPYGIMVMHDEYWRYQTIKQPEFLHKDKADQALFTTMLNRATNELVHLRSQLYMKLI